MDALPFPWSEDNLHHEFDDLITQSQFEMILKFNSPPSACVSNFFSDTSRVNAVEGISGSSIPVSLSFPHPPIINWMNRIK